MVKHEECNCWNWAGMWTQERLEFQSITGHHYNCPDVYHGKECKCILCQLAESEYEIR